MKTLVIQSSKVPAAAWIEQCKSSVRDWAASQQMDYRFVGDEIFDLIPDWFMHKVGQKKQVATDLGRLYLLQSALDEQGFDQAIWFDADMFVLDQGMRLTFTGSCAFGQEVWIQQEGKGRLKARRNIHNAVCVFRQGCPVLPFLIHTCLSLMARVDAQYLVPQFLGPKLLGALHPLADFSLLPQIGAFSPVVVNDLMQGGGKALELMRQETHGPLQAANLCSSLLNDNDAEGLIARLTDKEFAEFQLS